MFLKIGTLGSYFVTDLPKPIFYIINGILFTINGILFTSKDVFGFGWIRRVKYVDSDTFGIGHFEHQAPSNIPPATAKISYLAVGCA
jgi:hypothetical protein